MSVNYNELKVFVDLVNAELIRRHNRKDKHIFINMEAENPRLRPGVIDQYDTFIRYHIPGDNKIHKPHIHVFQNNGKGNGEWHLSCRGYNITHGDNKGHFSPGYELDGGLPVSGEWNTGIWGDPSNPGG